MNPSAKEITDKFISFYTSRGHTEIENAALVPQNDPTTLFTSSGMQPLVPYLLGQTHPQGDKLVNVQNSFRAQDIEEIGDNRHTTFFRMLGNWSLGDYFKKEQLNNFWEFLTKELNLDPQRIFVTCYSGNEEAGVPKDTESGEIWKEIFQKEGIDAKEVEIGSEENGYRKGDQGGRIFYYTDKNWWSRAGGPDKMPPGEPGGPDSEAFYLFPEVEHNPKWGSHCHPNCDCGRYIEIGNSVFMQYLKTENGFEKLPKQNVDFGGGLERLTSAMEDKPDVFKTNLFSPIINSIERATGRSYEKNELEMRIITDHLVAGMFIILNHVMPSNTEQGYILRRLLRRAFDNFATLGGKDVTEVLRAIVEQYKATNQVLEDEFERINLTIIEEKQAYSEAISRAHRFLSKKYNDLPTGPEEGSELMGVREISADDAFELYATHGLSPTQIKSLGYTFNDQEFAEKMKEHQDISRKGAEQKFKGGLADQSENTLKGHTATHLLHKALRDKFGDSLHQAGSNITGERVRFDFTFDRPLTEDEKAQLENTVNKKIAENLPVYFQVLPKSEAEKLGALSFFGEKYGDEVKVYFIGPENDPQAAYSMEFCGGPHVENTSDIKSFKIFKEKSAAKGIRRIYAEVG